MIFGESFNPVCKKIIRSAFISLVLSIIIYSLSVLKFFNVEINLNSFYGMIACFALLFLLSSFWIFTYWNMDRLQKEPLVAVFKSYFSTLFVHFFLLMIFSRAFNPVNHPGVEYKNILSIIKYVLLPLFTLYVIFDFNIFRFRAFDESVDSLIYGAFVGTGLGSAMFLSELFMFECVSVQFFVQSLVIRLLLCSSVCSLAGALLNRLRVSSKIINLILPVVILFVVFAVHFILDSLIETNVRLAQIRSLQFILPVVLSLIIFVITVILVSKSIDKDFQSSSKNGLIFFRVYGVILLLMIVINGLYVQNQINKTVVHYSADKKWSYELPKEYIEEKKSGINSLFGKAVQQRYQKYKGNSCDIFISFEDSQTFSDSLLTGNLNDDSEVIKGWVIYELSDSRTSSYQLKKDSDIVLIQINQTNQNVSVNNSCLVKIIAKTLKKEAAYED